MKLNIFNTCMAACVAGALALGAAGCSDDDYSVFSHNSQLHSFGPSPALRGETIRIIGTGLDGVDKVIFPVDVATTEFVKKTAKEIEVVVPQDAVPGPISIVIGGRTVTSVSSITFAEPISIESVSPVNVAAGDVVTVTGDYLNNVASITFANGAEITTEDFATQVRKQLTFAVPVTAASGKITFSNGDDWDMEWETPLTVATTTVTAQSATDVDFGETLTFTGSNFNLVQTLTFPGGATPEFVVSDDNSTLTVSVPTVTCSGDVTALLHSGAEITLGHIDVPTIALASVQPAVDIVPGSTVLTLTGANLDRVARINVDGAAAPVMASELTLNNSGTQMQFTAPEGMLNGKLVLVQNDLITVESEYLKVKQTGSSVTVWSGSSFFDGGWGYWEQIGADAFADLQPGMSLVFGYQIDPSAGWWQIKPCAGDWQAISYAHEQDPANECVSLPAEATSIEMPLTQDDVDRIKASGMVIGGCNYTLTSVAVKGGAPSATVVWTGNLVMDGGWGAWEAVGADAFADVKAGTELIFTYDIDPSAGWWQIKPMDGNWTPLSYNYVVDPDWQCIPLDGNSHELRFTINEADATALKSSGMVISGCNCTVTKLAIN